MSVASWAERDKLRVRSANSRDYAEIMSVTLINLFEVPPGREEDAIAYWDRCADVLRRQPGFISARLHRATMAGARFPLVNVAEWESVEHFQTAVSTAEFQAVAREEASDFPHSPAMYDVVRRVH
jgi:heme oxygenase (mycobilin-producing)